MNITVKKKEETQFYNGNPNVKAAGAQHNYTKHEIDEFIKCSQNPLYFMNNYVKVVSLDGGLVPFKTYPYQNRVVQTIHDNRFTIAKIFRQSGKAVSLDTAIPTPAGFKPMQDIHVGDYVIGSDGTPAKVTFESEIQYPQMCRITFDTKETIVCSIDHLWTVRSKRTNKAVTLTAGEIIERGFKKLNKWQRYQYNFYIDNTKPVDVADNQLIIDPYCLGLWIGNGLSNYPMIIGPQDDVIFYQRCIRCFND